MRQGGRYRFAHDRVREAATELAPPAGRPATHLHIARQLLRRTPETALDEVVFEIVHHLEAAPLEVTDPDERRRAASLCLAAAARPGLGMPMGPRCSS